VLFVISHTGRSRTILDSAKQARKNGATVILITNFPVSPLAKHADIILLTAVFSKHLTGEVISKRVAELCIIESLYINYLIRKGSAALERLNISNEAVRVNKV
jgi:DNA-binding MurR/RpiR family transcriptional regulator